MMRTIILLGLLAVAACGFPQQPPNAATAGAYNPITGSTPGG
jgi:hypothetical protein